VGARPAWRLALALVLIALLMLSLGGLIDPLQSGALSMLPALLLAALMLTRPYLGERAIARLRACRRERPSPRRVAASPPRQPARVVRGGRLIALALAGRAPPVALAGCR